MSDGDLTRILERAREGDARAHEQLFAALYDELRALARRRFEHERGDHTLQSTALVHEVWLRLVDQTQVRWQNRAHFLAVAATAMRRVLVDHARRSRSEKRGGGAVHFSLTVAENLGGEATKDVDLLDLETALDELASEYPDQAAVVEMRFFGGMTAAEVATAVGVTERTIERRWRFARAWLYQRLERDRA